MGLPDGFGDAEWFEAWRRTFAPAAPRYRIELPDHGGQAELIEGRARVFRHGLRFLVAPVNVHSPRYGWRLSTLPDVAETGRRLRRCLVEAGCHGIELNLVPEKGVTLALMRALGASRRWRVSVDEVDSTLTVDTTCHHGVYEKQLPHRLVRNLDRQEAKLRGQGLITFHETGAQADWSNWFEAGLALEASGWKGAEGSAIAQGAEVAAFYREVAAASAASRRLRLYTLACDGRPIAFRLSILDEGTLFLLKTAYDEQFARFGPGNLLLRRVLRHAFDDPAISAVDLVGHPEWKRPWSTDSERLMRVRAAPAGTLTGCLLSIEPVVKRVRNKLVAPVRLPAAAGREDSR